MPNKTTEEQFDELIKESMQKGLEKMSQYGTSWTSYRVSSLLCRMLNKGKRIVTLQQTNENKVGEPIDGEFKEIMSYAVLLIIMHQQKVPLHTDLSPDDVQKYRDEVFQSAKELMLKKDHDYGGAWREMSQSMIVDEINVKIRRSMNMGRRREDENKFPADNIMDVINYCAFALILIAEGVHENK